MALTTFLTTPRDFWTTVLLASVAKLLMLKSYRSTDFEVHRNWMAITHSLPVEKWYYDETSEWTLDYPPFFAYFEWMLSQGAQFFDEKMLDLKNINYASNMTVFYQKLTVIITDLVLAYGVTECSKAMTFILPPSKKSTHSVNYSIQLLLLIFLNGGLFMVDHIHFQYNGFLFGVLILAISKICQGRCYQGAFLFAALLNLKHIYLYIAPAIGVYLLRKYCVRTNRIGVPESINLVPIIFFVGIVTTTVTVAFGPFYHHVPQILHRLFPFKRGLSHAYWAPNFWAAYNSLDLVLGYGLKLGKSGATSGLVGEQAFRALPQIQPIHTFGITLIVMSPILYKLWRYPTAKSFVYAVTLTAWTSFMFGYHVHEKAILNVIIPFSLIALENPNLYLLTLISGTVSLFPLLFTPFEIVLKAVIAVCHITSCSQMLPKSLKWFETLYIIGFFPLYFFENLGHFFFPNLQFLPLLLVSEYCLLGIAYSFTSLYWTFLFDKRLHTEFRDKEGQSHHVLEDANENPPVNKLNTSTRVLRKRI